MITDNRAFSDLPNNTIMPKTKMQIFLLLSGLVLVFLTACGGNSTNEQAVDKPENLLSEEEMVRGMLETQLLEARLMEQKASLGQDTLQIMYNHYEKELLARLGTDSTTFYASHEYYVADLEMYHRIMSAVADSIDSQRRAQVEETKAKIEAEKSEEE